MNGNPRDKKATGVRKQMKFQDLPLNMDAEVLKRRNSLWTAREICQQPRVWRKAYCRIEEGRESIDDWLAPVLAKPKLRIYFCGAGSSAFIGETVAAWLRKQHSGHAIGTIQSVHTTDLASDPAQYLGDDVPTLLVSLARSGDSPESLACLQLADKFLSDCNHLILTCNRAGRLAKEAGGRGDAFCLLMPAETNDRSFAMTSSFTTMLVSCLALFTPDAEQLDKAARWAERLLRNGNPYVTNIAQCGFRRIAVLGAGCLLGVAREAALKCLELTAGKVVAIHDSPLGFRHGPKMIIDESTLVVHMRSSDPHTQLYDQDLLDELRRDDASAAVIELHPDMVVGEAFPAGEGTSQLDDAWLSLVYLVVCQMLAFHKAMAMGVEADVPCTSGEVNRVVSGVTIYPFTADAASRPRAPQVLYGLDIGGTKMEFGVYDAELNRLHAERTPTPVDDYDRFLETIGDFVTRADQRFEATGTIGFGLPGIIDRQGKSLAVNVPCLTGRDARKDLVRLLERPIAIINDGRAFALSEAHAGAADGHECMIGITLGTGVVGGYCIGGHLQAGSDGIAGEWGHIPLASSVRMRHGLPLLTCRCGATACAECYVSGPGMSRIHEHLTGKAVPAAEVVDGMRKGEASCIGTFDIWTDCVASCLASMVLHINPSIIVIGGGLSEIQEIYERLPGALSGHLLDRIEPPVIAPAKHGGASGGRGAAIVGAQECGWTGAAGASHELPVTLALQQP